MNFNTAFLERLHNEEALPLQRSTRSWTSYGRLISLHSKRAKESVPRTIYSADAVANFGLACDKYASPLSPRQILIASEQTYKEFNLQSATLSENLLVDFATEKLHSGDLLCVGTEVVLWLTFQCEPCSILERKHAGILKNISTKRGILARVVRGGTISVGDKIALSKSSIPPLSNDWKERIINVVRAIPPEKNITYSQLAEFAGVATAYCRAFPKVLSTLPLEVSSRVKSSKNACVTELWNGAELFEVQKYINKDLQHNKTPNFHFSF